MRWTLPRSILDDHPDACRDAIRAAHAKGARDAMLHLHAAAEVEARAGLAWWCALFAAIDAMGPRK